MSLVLVSAQAGPQLQVQHLWVTAKRRQVSHGSMDSPLAVLIHLLLPWALTGL